MRKISSTKQISDVVSYNELEIGGPRATATSENAKTHASFEKCFSREFVSVCIGR